MSFRSCSYSECYIRGENIIHQCCSSNKKLKTKKAFLCRNSFPDGSFTQGAHTIDTNGDVSLYLGTRTDKFGFTLALQHSHTITILFEKQLDGKKGSSSRKNAAFKLAKKADAIIGTTVDHKEAGQKVHGVHQF